MHSLIIASSTSKLKLLPLILPLSSQVRFKKIPPRKPRCLPMSPHKIFRIPKHPEVPKDEKQLTDDLLEEYYIKVESLRKLFQEEIKQKACAKDNINILKQKDAEQFKLLLEENKEENERVRVIREQTLEQDFQEKLLVWLQMAEEKKKEQEETKLRVDKIIRAEKEKDSSYITLENLDEAIEKAIDNPVNCNFSLSVDGTIKWEGKPSLEYEADINRRVAEGKKLLYAVK